MTSFSVSWRVFWTLTSAAFLPATGSTNRTIGLRSGRPLAGS